VHLIHSILHEKLCLPLHPSLSEEEAEVVNRLNESVRQSGISTQAAVSWQKTLFTSLPVPNNRALLPLLHTSLCKLMYSVGLVPAPSQASKSITIGYGRLKIAIEVLWEIVNISRSSRRSEGDFGWEVCIGPMNGVGGAAAAAATSTSRGDRKSMLGLLQPTIESQGAISTVFALGLTGFDARGKVHCFEEARLNDISMTSSSL
jgi:hypothetical protein